MSKKLQKESLKPSKSATKNDIPPSVPQKSSNNLIYIILLTLFTFLVYSRGLKNDFVNWDDDRNVYENPHVVHLTIKNIKAIFTSDVIGNYNPLPILSFAIENHFFGMDPKVMHFTNILLHLICTILVFFIFKRLKLSINVAFIGALLFALHPLKVESVAWITERKDVLFGCFFLGALLLYIKNLDQYSKSRSVWIFVLFIIGLFAKIQMVALPLTFLAVDYWFNKEMNFKIIIQKWPYFLGSLAFGLLGIYMLQGQGSLETNTNFNFIERLFIGSYSFLVYIVKFFVPYKMLPLYAYSPTLDWMHYLSMPIVISLFIGLYLLYKKDYRAVLFGFTFFFFNIVFLLQILGAGQGYLADRFTYIAYIGLIFICCYYLDQYLKKNTASSTLMYSISGIYIILLSFLSYKQIGYWKNSGTLWSRVLEYQNNTSLPYNNRANYLRDLKLYDQALLDYNRAIELKAGHATYNSRARLFFNKDENQKAINDYNMAISLEPNKAEYYINRGAAKARLGGLEEAIKDFDKGLTIDPTWKVGYLNRSIIYNQSGNFQKALEDIDQYLKFDPNNSDIWYEGGRCLRALNDLNKAITYYTNAIKINPKGLYYLERGKTYKILGQEAQAQNDINKARSLGEPVNF
jgi:tetratricopeptide (TPR) repeat protein